MTAAEAIHHTKWPEGIAPQTKVLENIRFSESGVSKPCKFLHILGNSQNRRITSSHSSASTNIMN